MVTNANSFMINKTRFPTKASLFTKNWATIIPLILRNLSPNLKWLQHPKWALKLTIKTVPAAKNTRRPKSKVRITLTIKQLVLFSRTLSWSKMTLKASKIGSILSHRRSRRRLYKYLGRIYGTVKMYLLIQASLHQHYLIFLKQRQVLLKWSNQEVIVLLRHQRMGV